MSSPTIGASDHNILSFTLALSLPVIDNEEIIHVRPKFNPAYWNSLMLYMSALIWTHEFSSCVTATEMWSKYVDEIQTGISHNVTTLTSYKLSYSADSRHYYPARIRKLYAKKLRCWKLYKIFRSILSSWQNIDDCLKRVHSQSNIFKVTLKKT